MKYTKDEVAEWRDYVANKGSIISADAGVTLKIIK